MQKQVIQVDRISGVAATITDRRKHFMNWKYVKALKSKNAIKEYQEKAWVREWL